MSIESVLSSNHLILCHPLLLFPSLFPSIRVFSTELALGISWPEYWSFSFSISPSNKYSGLISFRIDWFDVGCSASALKSLLQHHNSKASILQCSAFFTVQFSHLHVTTGKTIALTIWNFVSKLMSFLFSTLSRFTIAFLPRSKHLLIVWLRVTICSAFGDQEHKICHCFHIFLFYLPWSDGAGCHDVSFLECWVLSLFFCSQD